MPVSTPNGYLDFTNATPRATKVIATSNVGVGFNNPLHALDVAGSANVGALTATTLSVTNTPLATLAANLVTYDSSTGVFQDSGGLFSNKLAVVSEQPPSALGGASTTVEKHGVYKVTASTGTPQNAFDKATGTSWVGSSSYAGGFGAGLYTGTTTLATGLEQGDWLAVEFPYKATLRHLTLTAKDAPTTGALPNKANLYATNDSLVWTELKNWESNENTIVVNATEAYKKFALVTTKTRDSISTLEIGQLKLFCESFSVDGGKIEMATSAVTGGETVVEQTTAHAREPAVLKKYPEVAFADGKFEYNHDSNTYTQGGYTVSASDQNNDTNNAVYGAFDGGLNNIDSRWRTENLYVNNESSASPSTLKSSSPQTQLDTNTSIGEYLIIKTPSKIQLKNIVVNAPHMHMPHEVDIYGRNEGISTWSHIKNYTYTIPTGTDTTAWNTTNQVINATNYYSEYAFVVVKTNGHQGASIGELELYGYEERNTTGDLSLDTTITSKYNTPDLSNASLYLDGLKGSTATDYSGNELAVTENNVNWDSTEKSWTLSGLATSNIVSGDLGFEGDQPHSISAWVKADQLGYGTPLFHLGTAEGEGDAASRVGFVDDSHISWGGEDHYFSNAEWHNVTYTYNGEGSDKKLYLDGRLVGTAANKDTFGDYPPFAMSTYSEYGYTVSENHPRTNYENPYALFDNDTGDDDASPYEWWSTGDVFSSDGQTYTGGDSIGGHSGAYVKLELPHKLKLAYVAMWPRDYGNNTTPNPQCPKDFKFIASNDNVNWDLLYTETGFTDTGNVEHDFVINSQTGYKYYAMVISKVRSTTLASICELKLYGHRENDLVRFPDPTNVLKYPHVAMTGPARRGYVHTGSSEHSSSTFAGYNGVKNAYVFDDDPVTFWHAETNDGTNNQRYNGTDYLYSGINSLGGISGEWLKLQLPHKITLTRVHLRARSGQENQAPEDFTIIGSNDDSSWTTIQAFTGESPQDDGTSYYDITSSPAAYKYLAIVIQRLVGTTAASLATLEFYGTEEDSDVVARIGDGYDGKVRNLRVFSTALSQDRVQEIFDADKDEFGLAKSSVSVYRGHLGIGTTEPKAALTVMDEVGELVQLPPGNMTADDQYFEKHGVFKARTSPGHDMGNYPPWEGFNDTIGTLWYTGYSDGSASYNGTSGAYSGTAQLGSTTKLGEYLILEMPYKVFPKHFEYIRQSSGSHLITNAYVYGRNGSNGIWTEIGSFTDGGPPDDWVPKVVDLDNSVAYDQLAFVPTKRYAASATAGVSCHLIRYFGTREQGASTLHNGELTLTRNLTVPRIGPALDADDTTPRRDRLVVEYNTSTNPTENGVVKDTSGRGLDGFMYGAYYDATEKALRFDGTDDYIKTGTIHGPYGQWPHSISLWFRTDGETSETWDYLCQFGTNTTGKSTLVGLRNENISFSTYGDSRRSSGVIANNNTWYHVVGIYPGGVLFDNAQIYVNGVLYADNGGADDETSPLSFDSSGNFLILGNRMSLTNSELGGYISNFKLYDVALTASEVKTLYDVGRCDEGGHVVNFSKTRVGIGLGDGQGPRSALDVRDKIYAASSTVSTFTGQHKCVPSEPMEEGLVVSADKNEYVKLNGGLASGQGGITIDESLPIVSLSKTANDKKCFGVVSSVEKANTVVRTETTGGVVSDAPKVLGDNRAIVNSVGEGAIWVCDAGGSLESGDYITTSAIKGYGQKQSDDLLHNYTVAKVTMDCDFTATPTPVRAIKKIEDLVVTTEGVWSNLTDYNRHSFTALKYVNASGDTLTTAEYVALPASQQGDYTQQNVTTYYKIQRGANLLDDRGNLQWEDTDQTEAPYKVRFLDATGTETDEANCVHRAAFVGCTYHCG